MKNAEAKGEEGEVDEAQELFQQAEELQQNKAGLEAKALQVRGKGKRVEDKYEAKGPKNGNGQSMLVVKSGGTESRVMKEGTEVVKLLRTEQGRSSDWPPLVAGGWWWLGACWPWVGDRPSIVSRALLLLLCRCHGIEDFGKSQVRLCRGRLSYALSALRALRVDFPGVPFLLLRKCRAEIDPDFSPPKGFTRCKL